MRRGAGCALVLCAAASAAWGQAGPGTAQGDSPSARIQRSLEDAQRSLLDAQAMRALQGTPLSDAEKAVQAVTDALRQGDCPGAARELNAGLAKSYPEVLLLAGAMLEEGICLKPNWDRAVALYEKAAAAGRKEALARIAAGYAAPIGGRDMAAALWWALRAKAAVPAPCAQVASLVDDADKFVSALKAWPAAQFSACVYSAAVMSSIQGDAAWPRLGVAYGLQGKVRFVFVPERGQVDVVEEVAAVAPNAGVAVDAVTRERDLQAARTAFSASLRQLADRALKRFDKPAGVPAAWRVEAEYLYAAAP